MKIVILAGGMGTRLVEETVIRPKPMIEIGHRPILWHIMKHYAHYGFKEFLIALGYKGEFIKEFFLHYHQLSRNITVNLATGEICTQGDNQHEDWLIHLIDTGLTTMTGGRVKRLQKWLQNETFMVTYGDGVSNIDLKKLVEFHRSHGKLATVSAVRPPARFGGLVLDEDRVADFTEKPQSGEGWINGGFLVFEPDIFDYLHDDTAGLEVMLLERLAAENQLMAYRHDDFWQCMDTMRDVNLLRQWWDSGNAPWAMWSS